MSDSELIDWEQLEMIFGEDEEDFDEDMAELFHEFVEDAHLQFSKITESEFAADKQKVAKEAHKLKGSTSNFGFTRVAALLARIEDEIGSLSAADFAGSVEGARAHFEESVAAVMRRYPALGAVQN